MTSAQLEAELHDLQERYERLALAFRDAASQAHYHEAVDPGVLRTLADLHRSMAEDTQARIDTLLDEIARI